MFMPVFMKLRGFSFFGFDKAFSAHADAVEEDKTPSEIDLLKKNGNDQE